MNKTTSSRCEQESKPQYTGINYSTNHGTLPIIATNKPSMLDNFKGKRHTFNKQDSIKRGKTMTPYRLKIIKLAKIKKCSKKCPIYPCRYHPLSKAKYDGKCALNQLEPSTRRKYVNLLIGGEDDLFTEATNAVMTVNDGYKTVSCIEKIHKMRYGSKVKNEVVASSGSFFDELRGKVKELKEEDKDV